MYVNGAEPLSAKNVEGLAMIAHSRNKTYADRSREAAVSPKDCLMGDLEATQAAAVSQEQPDNINQSSGVRRRPDKEAEADNGKGEQNLDTKTGQYSVAEVEGA